MCTQDCDSATTGENFGIHFDTIKGRFVLYRGVVFNNSDDYNIEIDLPSNLSLESDLPGGSNIVFEKVTGEVRDFDSDHHSFSLVEANSGQTRTFNFNELGVVDIN